MDNSDTPAHSLLFRQAQSGILLRHGSQVRILPRSPYFSSTYGFAFHPLWGQLGANRFPGLLCIAYFSLISGHHLLDAGRNLLGVDVPSCHNRAVPKVGLARL